MSFYVYLIHNILNNKVYVGKAKNPAKRWLKHLKVASGKRQTEKFYIHHAISKHGARNFVFSIIQKLENKNDCDLAEMYWIKYFQSKDNKHGYNLTDGGEGVFGREVSEATKQKQREKATGRKHTEKTKELLRQINIGKIPVNLEQLKTINIGRVLSEEHRQKISEARIGMVFTDEHRENMSKAMIGKFVGEENGFYGKTHTEEVKELSRGENNKQAKLTSDNVIEIRDRHNTGKYTQQQLADQYHVSREQISRIIRGIDWKHLLGRINE